VPLDDRYPLDRLRYILDDTGAGVVLMDLAHRANRVLAETAVAAVEVALTSWLCRNLLYLVDFELVGQVEGRVGRQRLGWTSRRSYSLLFRVLSR
jgi:hypothetical protein